MPKAPSLDVSSDGALALALALALA